MKSERKLIIVAMMILGMIFLHGCNKNDESVKIENGSVTSLLVDEQAISVIEDIGEQDEELEDIDESNLENLNKETFTIDNSSEDAASNVSEVITEEGNQSGFTAEDFLLHKNEVKTLYPIKKDKKYGYINGRGELVIGFIYDYGSDFVHGRSIVRKDGMDSIITLSGEVIYSTKDTLGEISNGMISYFKNLSTDITYEGYYGYVDIDGKKITEAIFTQSSDFNPQGFATVLTKEKEYQIINKEGKFIESYDPLEYKEQSFVIEDKYIIYFDSELSKYGVSQMNGMEVFPPIYSDIQYLNNDLFAMSHPQIEYYLAYETKPKAIFSAEKGQLTDYILYDIQRFNGKLTTVTDSEYTYFIDENGNTITQLPKFLGRGRAKLSNGLIKAYIDEELIYVDLDNTLIYQEADTKKISKDLLIKGKKYKANKYVTIRYPYLEKINSVNILEYSLINKKIEELFIKESNEYLIDDEIILDTFYDAIILGDILIIELSGYEYSMGAAHGMPRLEYYNFDLRTGESYSFADLFIDTEEFRHFVNNRIQEEIEVRSQGEWSNYFEGDFRGITMDQKFKLEEDSLMFYFYPYDIASYSEGFTEFFIELNVLEPYINKEGNFYKAIKGKGL